MNSKNKRLTSFPIKALALGATLMTFGTSVSSAALIAYDQFTGYTDGNLVGQGEGFGFGTNNWVGQTNASGATATSTGNLTYTGLTTTGGGAVSGNNGTGDNGWLLRNLENPITTTGTYYFGFLMNETGNPNKAGFRIQDSAGTHNAGAGAWDGQNNWQMYYTQNGSSYNKIDSGVARADTAGGRGAGSRGRASVGWS